MKWRWEGRNTRKETEWRKGEMKRNAYEEMGDGERERRRELGVEGRVKKNR